MTALNRTQLAQLLGDLGPAELAALVRDLETQWDLPAPRPDKPPTPVVPPPEVKTEFDLVLLDAGPRRIQVIKTLRSELGLGLVQARDLALDTPSTVLVGEPESEVERFAALLVSAGAHIEVR